MLEFQVLIIQRGDDETGWTILDAESRRLLGTVRSRAWAGPNWLRCLSRPAFEVYEADDEPLVFTVRRLWGVSSKWEVSDADGQRVALIRRRRIFDASGGLCALVGRTEDRSAMHFRGGTSMLADAIWSTEGVRLTFAPSLQGYPLVKMAVLSAVLTATV
jgi:hypothetical protein